MPRPSLATYLVSRRGIAGKQQLAVAEIEDGECEHAAHPIKKTPTTPFLETVYEHFGVRVMSAKLVPAAAQHGAEFGVVVHLAVNTTQTSRVSLVIGWSAATLRSTIASPNVPEVDIGSVGEIMLSALNSRLQPLSRPAATPNPSGPRWRSDVRPAAQAAGSTAHRGVINPKMPHIATRPSGRVAATSTAVAGCCRERSPARPGLRQRQRTTGRGRALQPAPPGAGGYQRNYSKERQCADKELNADPPHRRRGDTDRQIGKADAGTGGKHQQQRCMPPVLGAYTSSTSAPPTNHVAAIVTAPSAAPTVVVSSRTRRKAACRCGRGRRRTATRPPVPSQ